MNYQEKYIKYKNKYINLSNQIGSAISLSQKKLQEKLQNSDEIVGLYALAAPNDCASTNMKIEHFNNIQKVITRCNPDGLIVYDIQEEKCKNGQERPFKFIKKEQADIFANFISKKFPENPIILYRAIPKNSNAKDLDKWLDDSIVKRNVTTVVWIGGGSRDGLIDGQKAIDYIINKVDNTDKYRHVLYGGVCLPERKILHDIDEHKLMIDRTKNKYKFFITQIVYNYKMFEDLLNEYVILCSTNRISPARIIFNFALFSSDSTINFMECLGVIFDDTFKTDIMRIKSEISENMPREEIESKYIEYSLNKSCELYKNLIVFCKEKNIPFGFSADVVSGSKIEFEQSIELFNKLKEIK
jgi:hypothetical protein